MEFLWDEHGAASQPQHVALTRDEAAAFYQRVKVRRAATWLGA